MVKKSEYFLIRIFWIGRDAPPPFDRKWKKTGLFMPPLSLKILKIHFTTIRAHILTDQLRDRLMYVPCKKYIWYFLTHDLKGVGGSLFVPVPVWPVLQQIGPNWLKLLSPHYRLEDASEWPAPVTIPKDQKYCLLWMIPINVVWQYWNIAMIR